MDDNGTVVQWGVFEEERFEEWGRGVGIDALAGFDEFLHVVGPFEDDERAGLALRHVHTGLDIGVEIRAGLLAGIVAPEAEPLDERVAC